MTDNILVSREYLEALQNIAELYCPADIKDVLTMPYFIESERDVEVVANVLQNHYGCDGYGVYMPKDKPLAQAAINAMRYRKEGGE